MTDERDSHTPTPTHPDEGRSGAEERGGDAPRSSISKAPVVHAFEEERAPNKFWIGGKNSVSVPDQIIRAKMLIEQLKSHIGFTDARVCVIGAGFGGAAAAILAAEAGAKHVRLFDRQARPFSLQNRCTSRVIDPTEYHWPFPWYETAQFPLAGDLPFAFRVRENGAKTDADRNNRPANVWARDARKELFTAEAGCENLQLSFLTDVMGLEFDGEKHKVTTKDRSVKDGTEEVHEFDILICANVIGGEKCWVERKPETDEEKRHVFRSVAYWENDLVLTTFRALSATAKSRIPSMLVSGGGDGALQDFIYYSTAGRSPSEIIKHVGYPSPDVIGRVMLYVTQMERSWQWVPKEAHDVLLGCYRKMMQKCAKTWLQTDLVRHRLIGLIQENVKVVLVCREFARGFPLNAFVALAIDEVFLERGEGRIRYGRKVRSVTHENCSGELHSGTGGCPEAQQVCISDVRNIVGEVSSPETYDLILLRHGIDWNRPDWSRTKGAGEAPEKGDRPVPLWFCSDNDDRKLGAPELGSKGHRGA